MNGKSVKLNSSSICAEEEVGFLFSDVLSFSVFMSFLSNCLVSNDFTKETDWRMSYQGATIHICDKTIRKCNVGQHIQSIVRLLLL